MAEPVSAAAPVIGQYSTPTENVEHMRRYLHDMGEIPDSVIGGSYVSLVAYFQERLN